MAKGNHLLIDCSGVDRQLCLNDRLILEVMARAATRAGAQVISQVRYQFGSNSPPGFTAVVVLDESHCSAHSYADEGKIAMDVFTCGTTDPWQVLAYIREEVDLGHVEVQERPRFYGSTQVGSNQNAGPQFQELEASVETRLSQSI